MLYNPRMPKYVLSAHAQTVIAERSIDPEWIERALANPERTESGKAPSDLRHALCRIPERENRVLRVVYNDAVDPVKIVTVYFDRTLRNKL